MAAPTNWTYESFIKVRQEFDLGGLVTEQRHSLSSDLSEWTKNDLPRALAAFKEIDLQAIGRVSLPETTMTQFKSHCNDTWQSGGTVFVSGCGSTGRMAFVLEKFGKSNSVGAVKAVMAAGDIALVHSVAGFEDSDAFGARQLREAGFKNGDLLIACTEGGETPFVLGTIHEAIKLSQKPIYFLFCNPASTLKKTVERSRVVLEHAQVIPLELDVGPMALTGSTRLQATTVQMLVAGWALSQSTTPFQKYLEELKIETSNLNLANLIPLIKTESKLVIENKAVIYQSKGLPMAVFTDVAERGPTFSLMPLQPMRSAQAKVPQFVIQVPDTEDANQAWSEIFGRPASALNWNDIETRDQLSEKYIMDFDWSNRGLSALKSKLNNQNIDEQFFKIDCDSEKRLISIESGKQKYTLKLSTPFDWLKANLLLKIILNCYSTIVMGRAGRFHKNLMTYVRPTNGKLVDRSLRYVSWLLEDEGIATDDDQILRILFARLERDSAANESVVMNTYNEIKSKK